MAGTQPQPPSYFGDAFTAPGLTVFQRTVTGHNDDGKAYFLIRDQGDHRQVRSVPGYDFEAAEANIYNTFESPVDINKDDDLHATQHGWKGGHHAKNGTRCTILDFRPGAESPMHRGESLDYNVVLEGEFDLVLDSGEVTRMRRGDVNVQRATSHKWVNVSGNGSEPGRLFSVLVDIKPVFVNGQELKGFMDGIPAPYGFGVERQSVSDVEKEG